MSTDERLSYDEIVELVVDSDDKIQPWSLRQEAKIAVALRELRQRREDERVSETLAGAAKHLPAPLSSNERTQAAAIANRLLDEPYADPDDDIRVLARQFERSQEEIERLQNTTILRDQLDSLMAQVSKLSAENACLRGAPETSDGAMQAPIVKITVGDNYLIERSDMYAPGLPPGEHDLYCEPPAPGGEKVPHPAFETSAPTSQTKCPHGRVVHAYWHCDDCGYGPAEKTGASHQPIANAYDTISGGALPPEVLADALQDRVHEDTGAVRAGRSVKAGVTREPWKCKCGQLNSDWAMECGRCERQPPNGS